MTTLKVNHCQLGQTELASDTYHIDSTSGEFIVSTRTAGDLWKINTTGNFEFEFPVEQGVTPTTGIVNCSAGNAFSLAVAGATTVSFINVPADCTYQVTLLVNYTSGTITWPTNIKWPGGGSYSPAVGTNRVALLTSDNGTTWYAILGEGGSGVATTADPAIVTSASAATSTTQFSVTLPTVQNNDVIVVYSFYSDNLTVATPAGWTLGDTEKYASAAAYVFAKTLSSVDTGTTYTFVPDKTTASCAWCYVILRNTTLDNYINAVTSSGGTGLNRSNTPYAITTTSPKAIVLYIAGYDDYIEPAVPAGFTKLQFSATSSGSKVEVGLYYLVQTTPGTPANPSWGTASSRTYSIEIGAQS